MNKDIINPEVQNDPISRRTKVLSSLGFIAAGSLLITNADVNSHSAFEQIAYGAASVIGGLGCVAYEAYTSITNKLRGRTNN